MGTSIKDLDKIIEIFRGQARAKIMRDMRPDYEVAAGKQGWTLQVEGRAYSIWQKGERYLYIESGDRIRISFDGAAWSDFGQTARKRFLLGAQNDPTRSR